MSTHTNYTPSIDSKEQRHRALKVMEMYPDLLRFNNLDLDAVSHTYQGDEVGAIHVAWKTGEKQEETLFNLIYEGIDEHAFAFVVQPGDNGIASFNDEDFIYPHQVYDFLASIDKDVDVRKLVRILTK